MVKKWNYTSRVDEMIAADKLDDKGYEVEFEEQPMWDESEKMVD